MLRLSLASAFGRKTVQRSAPRLSRFASTITGARSGGFSSTFAFLSGAALAGGLVWFGSKENPLALDVISVFSKNATQSAIPAPTKEQLESAAKVKDAAVSMKPMIEDTSLPMRTRMEAFIRNLQLEIVEAMESLEGPTGAKFLRDTWERPNKEEGGGISCVLNHGKTFEKAAVLVSAIHGRAPPQILSRIPEAKRAKIKGPLKMYATGMSLVIHPLNPMAPTSHCNYRYIEVVDDQGSVIDSWFGGGSDLTPTYVIEEDAVHFHRLLKDASDPFDPSYYQKFKVEADKYFWIPHRQETRGVGGIFFDDFRGKNPEHAFAFVRSCGSAFVPMYQDIVAKRKDTPFTEAEKEWQMLRRGRYAEFNLVIDKGVKFGLVVPQARVESILASLPGSCKWEYMHSPVPGSREDATLQVLKNPRDWV